MAFLFMVIRGLSMLVLVDALMSWVLPGRDRFPRNILGILTEPLYRPVRAVLKPESTGGMDFSPLVVIVALQALANLIARMG